jgi:cytosine permease
MALPPTLRAAREGQPIPKRPWYLGIGPAYLTIFVWAPFFDPLWEYDLPHTSLPWLVGTAVLASICCYVFFYYPTAIWGYRTGQGLGLVAASTFGTMGSEWISGVGIGSAQLVWFAVAIDYGVESTFAGLMTCGLVPPEVLSHWQLGPLSLRNPVFLGTAAFWIFITSSASLLRLVGVIAALMRVYAPVALLLLTATALWMIPGLVDYQVENAVVLARGSGFVDEGTPSDSALPLFTGFFAMLGLLSVDWGAASSRRRDVAVGGLAGIVLAGAWTATMVLLVVAGAVGRVRVADPVLMETAVGPPPFSFRWGVIHGIGGYPASVILILFGLAALAPACYSSWVFSYRFAAHWPGIRRLNWTWIGDGIALLLIALSWSSQLRTIDRTMGVLFAPAIGAMTGDFLSQRGRWAGVRRGFNAAGLLAWSSGLALQWCAGILASRNPASVARWIPSPILGFASAVILYGLLARIGLERPPILLAGVENPDESSATRSDAEVPAASHAPIETPGTEPASPEACRDG